MKLINVLSIVVGIVPLLVAIIAGVKLRRTEFKKNGIVISIGFLLYLIANGMSYYLQFFVLFGTTSFLHACSILVSAISISGLYVIAFGFLCLSKKIAGKNSV